MGYRNTILAFHISCLSEVKKKKMAQAQIIQMNEFFAQLFAASVSSNPESDSAYNTSDTEFFDDNLQPREGYNDADSKKFLISRH